MSIKILKNRFLFHFIFMSFLKYLKNSFECHKGEYLIITTPILLFYSRYTRAL